MNNKKLSTRSSSLKAVFAAVTSIFCGILIISFEIRYSNDFRYSPSLMEPSDHHLALFFTHSGIEEESAKTLMEKAVARSGIIVINNTTLLFGNFRIK